MRCKPPLFAPLLVLLSASLAACASPAAPPPADPGAAPSTASGAPAAPPAPAASAPAAATTAAPAAPATPATPATTAAEEPSGPPDPSPLTEEEQKEAAKKCAPLTQAMQKAKGSGKSPLDALEAALKKPPAQLKGADLERCKELLTRGIETYLIAAKEVEARLVITQIGRAMALAYSEQGGKLCPASEHPVPADKARVAREPYVSTAADWDTPSWKCLGISLTEQPQRFQYETRVDPGSKTFEVIARGVPGGKGRWVELRQKGTVTKKGVEMGAVERK